MNKINYWISVMIILVSAQSIAGTNKTTQHTISVKGTSEFYIPADLADITIESRIRQKTTELAEKQGYETGIKLKKVFKKFGISEKHITGTDIGLKEEYDYRGQKKEEYPQFVIKYTIRFDQFDLIDTLRKDCIEAGATHFVIHQLNNKTLSKYLSEAKRLAFENAKQNAEIITEVSGLKLGKPIWISSNNAFYVEDYDSLHSEGLGSVPQDSIREPLFQQRQIRLTDTVDVKFLIE